MQFDPFDCIRLLELPKIQNVLQVGASGGQEIPLFVNNEIKHAILIEPLDYPFEVLINNLRGLENYIPIKTLVGADDDVSVTMFISSNDGQSSSILKPARHISTFPNVLFNEKISLKSFTLDSILKTVNNQHYIAPKIYDLIYIDVQGAELEVFKGARKALLDARYVFTEVGYGGGYEGDASYVEIINYLKIFNFNLVSLKINPNNGYGDAFFSKAG